MDMESLDGIFQQTFLLTVKRLLKKTKPIGLFDQKRKKNYLLS